MELWNIEGLSPGYLSWSLPLGKMTNNAISFTVPIKSTPVCHLEDTQILTLKNSRRSLETINHHCDRNHPALFTFKNIHIKEIWHFVLTSKIWLTFNRHFILVNKQLKGDECHCGWRHPSYVRSGERSWTVSVFISAVIITCSVLILI